MNNYSYPGQAPPPPLPPRTIHNLYSKGNNILQQVPPPPSYFQYGYHAQPSYTHRQQSTYFTSQRTSSASSSSTTNNIVLNFMQKKPDSNLIDLVCSYNDIINNEDDSNKSLFSNDILTLFDPLSTQKEEVVHTSLSSSASEIENNNLSSESTKLNSKFPDWETFDSPNTSFICDNNNDSPVKEEESSFSDSSASDDLKVCKKENNEISTFSQKLIELRAKFKHKDSTNTGVVFSPIIDKYRDDPLSIKLSISSILCTRPVCFTCDIKTSIEHIISHVVCSIIDNISDINMDNYVLKVFGSAEYLSSDCCLEDYEYVHQCHKFDETVQLTLIETNNLQRTYLRTEEDDRKDVIIDLEDLFELQLTKSINCASVNIILDILKKEMDKMRALSDSSSDLIQPQAVVQAIKATCTLLCHIEIPQITESVENLIETCLEIKNFKTEKLGNEETSFSSNVNLDLSLLKLKLNKCLDMINEAIYNLLVIYSHSFKVDFTVSNKRQPRPKDITTFLDTLLIYLGPVLNVPSLWSTSYEQFIIKCEIMYGTQLLGVQTQNVKAKFKQSFFFQLPLEIWFNFDTLPLCILPREAKVYITIYGIIAQSSDSKDSQQASQITLGWCGLQMMNYDQELVQGGYALGFYPPNIEKGSGPSLSNVTTHAPFIYIAFTDYEKRIRFPKVMEDKFSSSYKRPFDTLDEHSKTQIMEIVEFDSQTSLTLEQKEILWEKRHYLYHMPKLLPKVLESAHGWGWVCLNDIYSLLKEWDILSPLEALTLLSSQFPDIEVRTFAVKCLENISTDELICYLPQLVQVLRYEAWEDSAIVWFLLKKSLLDVRIAHHLYWNLKQNLDSKLVQIRMNLVLNSLLKISGRAMRERFEKQETLLNELSIIAGNLKSIKDGSPRATLLNKELETIHHQLKKESMNLPLSPSLEVSGLDVGYCSYFNSNTLPLKLVFLSPENKSFEVLFKEGDDLRQDNLTLQMIQLMNNLWLKEKLDLRIVTFACIPTDYKKGVVEMVKDSETLCKIHAEYGLYGSFKDRSIAEWLQKHNTSELEYQQAVENFTLSCAGYCVATYILGICDRHNDNIMLKKSGHIFHIDFGKFLGDSQMFGNIKRDRVPFVLTSDMAFVINGGEKCSKKFQNFIDLCCQAFNILRKHSYIFITLFSLMIHSEIPGVTSEAVSYVQRALLPRLSESEAMAEFSKMIQESLKSRFTQFNFFIHNLAQLRFSGEHSDPYSLSFAPKTFTREMDGKIVSLEVLGVQKRYDPEKYYLYIIKVQRENTYEPQLVSRTYREFIEFNQKMIHCFSLAKFISLSSRSLMGRNNVREVAEKRKSEIIFFLKSILELADEIAHCNLVYTFFHPLFRDQEGLILDSSVKEEIYSQRRESLGLTMGQIKLSIVYKKKSLLIMVMHAKNLVPYKESVPDSYVKTYLLPDPSKSTKRKTKIVYKTAHPTFMELLMYSISIEEAKTKILHASIWSHDRLQENGFLGAISIPLMELDLTKDNIQWYPLGASL